MWIGGAIGGAILILGVAALAAWKAFILWEERREFLKFQKSRPSFSEQKNPLYKEPTTQVQNPMMGSD